MDVRFGDRFEFCSRNSIDKTIPEKLSEKNIIWKRTDPFTSSEPATQKNPEHTR